MGGGKGAREEIKPRSSREERRQKMSRDFVAFFFFLTQLFFTDSSPRDGGGDHVGRAGPETSSVRSIAGSISPGLRIALCESLSVLSGGGSCGVLQRLQMGASGLALRLLISISDR